MSPKPLAVILAAFLLVNCQTTSLTTQTEIAPGPYDRIEWISGRDEAGFLELQEEIDRANFEFHLDHEEKLIPADSSMGKELRLSRLVGVGIIDRRKFPGFVVVQLHKLAQIDDVESRVRRINEFFFAQGSERVLVTGFRGMGRSIYSDKIKKPNKEWDPTQGR